MQSLDQLRALRIALADPDPASAVALSSALAASRFGHVATVGNLSDLYTRIRDTFRHPESGLSLVLLSTRLVQGGDWDHCRSLCALAAEAGVAVVLLQGADEPPDEALLNHAREAGVLDVLVRPTLTQELAHRVLVALSVQQERLLLRQREEDLQAELAERRVMETRLQHMAYHDELTGLWNRRRLKKALEVSVLRASNFRQPCALLLLDVDRFKLVNDLEGYDAGDRLLVEVSRMVRRSAEAGDTAARIGSDEFALLLHNCTPSMAAERAEVLRKQLEDYRFRYAGRNYRACASVGLATVTGEEEDLTEAEVLARADQACYVAKQHGRNRVHCYSDADPELEHLRSDHRWAPRIREGLERERFFFHYQPVVRVMDGAITHYELLVRMRGADGRVHYPSEFIPVAERTGLIHQLDLWVVDRAVDFLAELPPEHSRLNVAVNLSGYAFRNDALFNLLARKLDLSWVSPTRLVFEITETAAIDNLDRSREMVARLRALGCRFALDDFGSGFSTFNYLKHFPVDFLKLDGGFIVNLTRDATDRELVRHMISIAHSLGKKTIAEFVETSETLDLLRELGIDYVQGHYVGEAAAELKKQSDLPVDVVRGMRDELGLFDQDDPQEPERCRRAGRNAATDKPPR